MKTFHLKIDRRSFVKRTATVMGLTGLPAWFLDGFAAHAAPAPPLSANDKANLALIGCGGQGTNDAKIAGQFGNVIAVCDVDSKRAAAAASTFKGAKVYKDFRKLLERDDIHAVINGTPDHWHTLVNIAALRAGKDIYSEKPLTLTIDEGKRLVTEVAKTRRILQVGSQQRSDPRFRLACELVRNGRLGKLKKVITSLPGGPHEGPFSPQPVPAELDWDFWQGQAPEREYVPQRCHRNFRYWYEYSGGTMTDWGAHHNDIALWGIGLERSGPVEIEGRRLVEAIPGGYTAPSQYRVQYKYANGVEHVCQSVSTEDGSGRKLTEPKPGEFPNGVRFEGEAGWIYVTRGKIEASDQQLLDRPLADSSLRLYRSNSHMGNFFDCVRSRQQPICDAEIGHRSVSVCHLGVLAIRLGRKLRWDPAMQMFAGDAEANKWVAREMRKPWTYEMI